MSLAAGDNEAMEREARKAEAAKSTVTPVKSFLSGGFGGTCAVLVGESSKDGLDGFAVALFFFSLV